VNLQVCHRENCSPQMETEHPILVRCANCGLADGGVGVDTAEAAEKWNRMIEAHNARIFR
jgi:hypothetical protein